MTPQTLKRKIKLATILTTIAVVVLVCVITFTTIKIGVLNKRIAELDAMSATLTKQQIQLENGISIRETGSYVEQEAREEYGMAMPGDKIYVEK